MADCVQCGFCCTVGVCFFGTWDPAKSQCTFLTDDNLCEKYDEIKKTAGSEKSPAFGTACSSTLGNLRRQKKILENAKSQ